MNQLRSSIGASWSGRLMVDESRDPCLQGVSEAQVAQSLCGTAGSHQATLRLRKAGRNPSDLRELSGQVRFAQQSSLV